MVTEQTQAGVRTALERYRNTNQHRQRNSGTNYEILVHLNPPSENNSWPVAPRHSALIKLVQNAARQTTPTAAN
jgi:hypothetical protein